MHMVWAIHSYFIAVRLAIFTVKKFMATNERSRKSEFVAGMQRVAFQKNSVERLGSGMPMIQPWPCIYLIAKRAAFTNTLFACIRTVHRN